jgi:hypothetical protein
MMNKAAKKMGFKESYKAAEKMQGKVAKKATKKKK